MRAAGQRDGASLHGCFTPGCPDTSNPLTLTQSPTVPVDSSQLSHRLHILKHLHLMASSVLISRQSFSLPLTLTSPALNMEPPGASSFPSASPHPFFFIYGAQREHLALTLGTLNRVRCCWLCGAAGRAAAGGSEPASPLAVMQSCRALHANDAARGIPAWGAQGGEGNGGLLAPPAAPPTPAPLRSRRGGRGGMGESERLHSRQGGSEMKLVSFPHGNKTQPAASTLQL